MSKSTHTPLTHADVLHIAKLAKLSLTEAEVEKFKKQLEDTINYVENLDELDTKEVKPTSHSTDVTNVYFEDGTENKRLFTTDEALKNAKAILNEKRADLEVLAKALLEFETLTGEEIKDLLSGKKVRDRKVENHDPKDYSSPSHSSLPKVNE